MTAEEFVKEFGNLSDNQYCTQKHIEALLMIPEQTIEKARLNGGFIPFLKTGKSVRYRVGDIREYIAKNTHSLKTVFNLDREFDVFVSINAQFIQQDAKAFFENIEKDYDSVSIIVDTSKEKSEAMTKFLEEYVVARSLHIEKL
nr:hypothetical protein [uncultured Pseudogulbenkiania sp.]